MHLWQDGSSSFDSNSWSLSVLSSEGPTDAGSME